MYDILIVGGGAAGLMAAAVASGLGSRVLLIERGARTGKKLLITGKGRCNVTNNCDNDTLMKNIPRNGKFLYSAFSAFSSADIMSFFEGLGVPLKTERGRRVFPVSDRAADIAAALERAAKDGGTRILTNTRVSALIIEDGRVVGVKTDKGDFFAPSVLIATGGKSYPLTGSDGDGYTFARQAGHTVTALEPSLVPIVTEERYAADAMGLSLKNVNLSVVDGNGGKVIFSEQGEMLFTHYGVSGPLVLSASSHIRRAEAGRYKLFIDLKPALSHDMLDARLLRDFAEQLNRDFSNSLGRLLPAKLIPVIVKLSGITPDTKVNSVTREERRALVGLIKAFPLSVKCFRPIEEAIITSGGVSVKELYPKTMGSKLVKGLYFAGEAIDCDAYTGGFNLQIAFSTAYSAAVAMAYGG